MRQVCNIFLYLIQQLCPPNTMTNPQDSEKIDCFVNLLLRLFLFCHVSFLKSSCFTLDGAGGEAHSEISIRKQNFLRKGKWKGDILPCIMCKSCDLPNMSVSSSGKFWWQLLSDVFKSAESDL